MRKLTTGFVLAVVALTGCSAPADGKNVDPGTATTISSDRQLGPVPASEIITRVTAALDKAGTFTTLSHAEFEVAGTTRITDSTAAYDFRNPAERRLHMTSTTGDDAIEIITIGATTYLRTGEDSWTSHLDAQTDQTTLFPDGTEGTYVAREEISGLKLHHYRYRSAETLIDLYLDDDDRPIVTIATLNGQPMTLRYTGFGDDVDIQAPDPSLVTAS